VKKFDTYNDGVISIYKEKEKQTTFGAKQNVAVLDDMTFIAKLDFQETSKREQDLDFAEQNSCTLSLKVKTRYAPNIDNTCKAVVNNYLYDIWYVDKTKTQMFLYMEGVRPIDT
jgi:hypothetical protein